MLRFKGIARTEHIDTSIIIVLKKQLSQSKD